jgi:hypothetical protein
MVTLLEASDTNARFKAHFPHRGLRRENGSD